MANYLETNLAYTYVSGLEHNQELVEHIMGAAIKRGDAMKAAMLDEEGGTLDVEGFAAATGTLLMELLDLILAGRVIQVWVESARNGLFPAFQARNGRLLRSPGSPGRT